MWKTVCFVALRPSQQLWSMGGWSVHLTEVPVNKISVMSGLLPERERGKNGIDKKAPSQIHLQ